MRASTRQSAILFAVMAGFLVTGCFAINPSSSNGPGAQTPAPGATPTAKPSKKPKPSATPTLPPTAPPTVPPSIPTTGWPAGAIASVDAASHVGEHQTVCGTVVSANWVFALKGHPTWLNIDQGYPAPIFNVVIWGEQRRAWPVGGKPEVAYLNHVICTSGVIDTFKTWTQIQDVTINDIQVIP
jgi:hypothetical protein